MTRDASKYCEECKHCKKIREMYISEFYVSCKKEYFRFKEPVIYCKYKKLKKEKKKRKC